MIAFTIAGASQTVVTRERSISSTTAAASNTRWMIVVAPAAMSVVVVRSSAPTWYSGPHASPRSALVKPNSTMWARFFHARLAWVSITPFGRPVVPDVYIRRCTASAATGTRATASCDRRSASARPAVRCAGRDAHAHEVALHAGGRLVGERDELPVAHERAGLGVVEDVAQLRRGEPPVDRHRDRAEMVGGEDRLQELGAVVRQQADDVARTHATRLQPGRERTGAPGHLAVGDRLAAVDRQRRGPARGGRGARARRPSSGPGP